MEYFRGYRKSKNFLKYFSGGSIYSKAQEVDNESIWILSFNFVVSADINYPYFMLVSIPWNVVTLMILCIDIVVCATNDYLNSLVSIS